MKHDCDSIQFQVSELLDKSQALSPELSEKVQSCADCRHFHQLWAPGEGLADIAKLQSSHPVSPYFYEQIADNSAHSVEPLTHEKARNYYSIAGIAAAVVAAIAFTILLTPDPEGSENSEDKIAGVEATVIPQETFTLPPLEKSFSKENIETGLGIFNDTTASSWRKAQAQISLVQEKFVMALEAL